MEQNDLIKKALLVELYRNAPEDVRKMLRTNEVEIIGGEEASKKVAELGTLGYREFAGYEYGYKYRVFTFPELTDSDIANLEQLISIRSNCRLEEIENITDKIHFWVRFWSVLYLIGFAIATIAMLISL